MTSGVIGTVMKKKSPQKRCGLQICLRNSYHSPSFLSHLPPLSLLPLPLTPVSPFSSPALPSHLLPASSRRELCGARSAAGGASEALHN